MKVLTENTKISVSLFVLLVGGIFWLSKIYFLAESNAATLTLVTEKQDRYSSDISAIRESIVKIETDVSHLTKQMEK